MKNKKVYAVVRVLFGLWMLFTGLNFFFQFMSQSQVAPAVEELTGALFNAGYFFPVVGGLFVLIGLSLLLNRYVPLAMLLLAPITVNVVLLHLFLDPATIAGGIVLLALNIYVAWIHWNKYKPILQPGINQ